MKGILYHRIPYISLLLFVLLMANVESQSSDCYKIDRSRPEWTDSLAVSVHGERPVDGVSIRQAAPNPFDDAIIIEYDLPRPDKVSITIIDLNGRKIKSLAGKFLDAGRYQTQWDGKSDDGSSQPPGLYIIRLETSSKLESAKIILSK